MHARSVLPLALSVLLLGAPAGHACTTDPDCDDGNVCNGAETCVGGSCQAGTPAPNGSSCSDGNACNGVETCLDGTCYQGYPINCGPPIPGTMEWCDPVMGCRFQLITGFTRCEQPTTGAFGWVQAQTGCRCDDSLTHGQYVRCIAGAAADGGLTPKCRADVKRCAVRSTCGQPSDFVTCCFTRPGSRPRCRPQPSAATCTAHGGVPGPTGSCCDSTCSLR